MKKIMVQIEEMFTRFIEGKPRAKRKWQMVCVNVGTRRCIHFYHYHHLVAIYDTIDKRFYYEWYEVPADYRGLASIKAYMTDIETRDEVIRVAKEETVYYETNR